MAHPTNGASNRFNIEKLFQLLNGTNRNVYNNKTEADTARVEMEQNATDSYLNLVSAEQNITDLQLQIWELGGTH